MKRSHDIKKSCPNLFPLNYQKETVSYNEKLKKKITSQAKRLTKLANEREELLELLRERTMSDDSSYSSVVVQTNKSANLKNIIIEGELEKSKKDLKLAQEKISELEKNKNDLNNFKETISKRLNIANEDIEKTKITLTEIQNEKESLLIKVKDNEQIIRNLREEKKNFVNKISSLETELAKLQKNNCDLSIALQKLKEKNEKDILNTQKFSEGYNSQILNLNKKNKKLFQDNKQLSLQIKNLLMESKNLKTENEKLRQTNLQFNQQIENLTKQLQDFQNDITKTLKKTASYEIESTKRELEHKQNEFLSIIQGKDFEINKLKELNDNYVLLEKELNSNINKLNTQVQKLTRENQELKTNYNQSNTEVSILQDKYNTMCNDFTQKKNELDKMKWNYEEMTNQLQNANNMKNTQINNLKNYVQMLEEKSIAIGKNKKYLEHLLISTHPNSKKINQILEIYNEIVDLDVQKKNFEKEYLYNDKENQIDGSIINKKRQAVSNIEEQINSLKQSLRKMEDDITIY